MFTLDKKQVSKVAKQAIFPYKKIFFYYLLFYAFNIFVTVIIQLITHKSLVIDWSEFYIRFVIVSFLSIIMFFVLSLFLVIIIRSFVKNYYALNAEQIWVYDDKTINFSYKEITSNVPFHSFMDWKETKDFLLLNLTKSKFVILPKNSMSEDELADFRAILQSQIQKR